MQPSKQWFKPDPYSPLESCYSWLEQHLFFVRQPALSAMFVTALSLAVAFPNIRAFTDWHPAWYERAIDWQLHHPLSVIPAEQFAEGVPESGGLRQGEIDHLHKQTYRVTLPLIAYCLGLDVRVTEILAVLSSIAFVVVILFYFRRVFPEHPVTAFLLAVSVGCSFVGQWGAFVHIGNAFDGFSYLLLASVASIRNPLLILIMLFAGGFSDERIILAAPLIYLLHSSSFPGNPDWKILLRPNGRQYGIVAGIMLFIAGRLLLGIHIGHLFNTSGVGGAIPRNQNLILLPLGWLLVFKGGACVMAAGFRCLLKGRSAIVAVLLLISSLPAIMGSVLVWDLSKSLVYTFPALLFCTNALLEHSSFKSTCRIALCGALISACLPTYYLWGVSVRYLPPILRLFLSIDTGVQHP